MSKRDDDADLVFRQAVLGLPSTLLFFGAWWLAVFILGQWFRFVAIIGIAAFGVILLWNLYRTVVAFGLGALIMFRGTSATRRGTEAKFWAAKALLLVETFVYAVFVWLLYLSFFATGRG